MAETIHVRGEGGQTIEMDLPLPEPIADRLTKGQLRRVNPDGSPYTGSPDPSADAEALEEQDGHVPGQTPRPAANARKAEWVGWAVDVHGMDPEAAEGMTKQDLADLPDQPKQPATPADVQALAASGDGRPAEDADKSEWIGYVVRLGKLSAEDAANYTKADLIDLAN
jgi:cell division septation protein DedD